MVDYNLSGLNPREFEHLIQAFGPLRQIASGAPFGRFISLTGEATSNGKMFHPLVS